MPASSGMLPGCPAPTEERRRALVWGLVLSLAVLTAASFAAVGFSANAPLIRDTFGLSHLAIGAITSAIYAAASVTSVIGGRLTDRVGPGPVLVFSLLALALGVGVAALAPGAAVFFLGVLVCGMGYGAANPPTNILANPSSAGRRGLAMSAKQSGIPLGGIAAGAGLPAMAAAAGWRWAMAAPVALCALLVVAAARVRGGVVNAATLEPEQPRPEVVLVASPGYAFGFLMAGVQATVFTFLTVYLTEDRHLSVGRAGSLLAVLMAGGLAGRPVWGWFSDRHKDDRIRVLQAASFLSCAGLALVPVLGVPALAAVTLVIGFSAVGWNGVYLATVAESVAPDLIGTTTGMALLLVNAGAVVLPPAYGTLIGLAGWPAGWYGCAVLTLLALVVLQLSRSSGNQETADG